MIRDNKNGDKKKAIFLVPSKILLKSNIESFFIVHQKHKAFTLSKLLNEKDIIYSRTYEQNEVTSRINSRIY